MRGFYFSMFPPVVGGLPINGRKQMSETKTMNTVKAQILGLTKTVYSFDYNGQTVFFKLPTIKQDLNLAVENENFYTNLIITCVTNETGSNIFTEEDREALEEMPLRFGNALLDAIGDVQNQKKE